MFSSQDGRSSSFTAASGTGTSAVVHDAEAKVVCEIFGWYAAGWSPRRIADELNRKGVPSPGESWSRTIKRNDGKWLASAIYGDPKRGSGILNNSIYRGVREWNRSRRDRDPETNRKVFKRRPAAERVAVDVPHLRVVDDVLWERVAVRLRERSARIGAAVRRGLSVRSARASTGSLGRMSKHLWSGLLKCGECGASLVLVGEHRNYVCASRTNGGKHACGSTVRAKLSVVEERLAAAIRRDLLAPESVKLYTQALRVFIAERRRESASSRRERDVKLAKAQAAVENLTDAIATVGLKNDATLTDRLVTARAQVERLERDAALAGSGKSKVDDLVPRDLVEEYRKRVARFSRTVFEDKDQPDQLPEAARELAALLGGAVRVYDGKDGPVADLRISAGTLIAVGLGARIPAEISNGSGGRICSP